MSNDEALINQDRKAQRLVCVGCKNPCQEPSDFDMCILDCSLKKIERQNSIIDELQSGLAQNEVELMNLERDNRILRNDIDFLEQELRDGRE
jgi:hypothetical protein